MRQVASGNIQMHEIERRLKAIKTQEAREAAAVNRLGVLWSFWSKCFN
jgi:hypothetical protein